MKKLQIIVALSLTSTAAIADIRALVPENVLKHIAEETSGETAKRNLDTITLQHRMRASSQFDLATQHILNMLKHYELDDVKLLEYAADGKTLFGTQKSRPVWDVRFAELWELKTAGNKMVRDRRLANWDAAPLTLAQDSLSGDVTTTLVDIGAGVADGDYENKDIRNKLVLTSSQPGAVVDKAVGELGAAGIVSYAPNQKSAWWKEDDRLVRWGHIGSFPKTKSFGFMISLGEARKLQKRLADGEEILFHAKVDASHEVGQYAFATAAIAGTDQKKEEINFTCHLDHPRPGANDNASGCVSILETARTLNTLIKNGSLARPARTLRFLWPAEIEGSIMYLSQHADPSQIKANIHMDMVGGAQVTKSVFRISGGPISVSSFVSDLGHEIGHFVNQETEQFASGETVDFPLIAPEGGKEPLLALMEGLDMGSDHDVFFEGSWAIPGLYIHEWPDRYIHTNYDLAANIDPTKLKRAAFIGAVSGWFLANMSEENVPAVLSLLRRNALARSSELLEKQGTLDATDASLVTDIHFEIEQRKLHSIESFAEIADVDKATAFVTALKALVTVPPLQRDDNDINIVYERNSDIQGPMRAFGYSYLEDKYPDHAKLSLNNYTSEQGSSGEYVYEALNLVNGERTVTEIRNWLTAELGPVPVAYVAEYLSALESIKVVREAKLRK